MRSLTRREMDAQYGGVLPPDATLRPADEEPAATESPPPPRPARGKPAARSPPRPARGKPAARSNRFASLNAFVDFGVVGAALTPAEAIVWLVLFRDTKADGTARTSQADIARRARLSVRGVKLAIRSLKAKGMIQVVQRGRLNAGPSTYRVQSTPHMG